MPKLYNWVTSSYQTLVTPNQLVMVIARPNNLNMSCKLYPYSFQRTRFPHPGPRLSQKLRNTYTRNYYDPKGKGMYIFLFFKKRNQFCELNYHDQKIRRTPTHDIREHWTAVSTLLGLISSVYRNLDHWRSNQRPQIAVPKLYNWATSSYRTQVTPNQITVYTADKTE